LVTFEAGLTFVLRELRVKLFLIAPNKDEDSMKEEEDDGPETVSVNMGGAVVWKILLLDRNISSEVDKEALGISLVFSAR
jgi:hypothetical protein